MRKSSILLPLLSAMAFMSAMGQAPVEIQQQRLEADHRIVYFGDQSQAIDTTATARLISRFYMDQFRHAQDPRAPYFMLMSRNGNLAMGIGGVVKAVGFYDWDGTVEGTDFAPALIPIPMDPSQVTSMQTSIAGSALFFSVFGTDDRFGNYQLYIEAKFGGGGHRYFQLKKAYATVGDWTLGLTKSTFVDPSAQPSTLEGKGPNSETDGSRFLLRYMHSVGKRFTFAVSAETPSHQIPTSGAYEGGSVYMPDFAAFIQYGTKNQHVRLSGIVKSMRYRDLVDNHNEYATAVGVNLTTVFRPVDPVTVYAAVNAGRGIGSMVNDLSFSDNDLLGMSNEPGRMYTPKSYGWYGAVQYNYSPSVFSTVIVSQERILPKHDAIYGGSDYKYGLYGAANVFWNITPRCQMGAELCIGKRANMDGTNRLAYRAGLLAEFSF